jgi:hypothetical protein
MSLHVGRVDIYLVLLFKSWTLDSSLGIFVLGLDLSLGHGILHYMVNLSVDLN